MVMSMSVGSAQGLSCPMIDRPPLILESTNVCRRKSATSWAGPVDPGASQQNRASRTPFPIEVSKPIGPERTLGGSAVLGAREGNQRQRALAGEDP